MNIHDLVKLFDGQRDEQHIVEVSLTDVRAWASQMARLRIALSEIESHPNVSAVIKLRARMAQTPLTSD